jgi:hypothetical protein
MDKWRNTERRDRFVFEQIDPLNLDISRGYLEGVVLRGSSLSEGYYTDTRISGQLEIVNANYIENSMIRIHHHVDEWDYHNVLGTFFVLLGDASYQHGVWSGVLELKSALYGLQEDYWAWNYTIPAGSYTNSVFGSIFDTCQRKYSILSSVNNTKYAQALCHEFGKNILTSVFETCDKCNARLGVNSSGVVTVSPYINPANIAPIFEYDYDAKDSLIVSEVTRFDNGADRPGRVGVGFKSGDTEILAYSDVSSASSASRQRRGYTKTNIHTLSDMSPQTKAQAQQLAKNYLGEESTLTEEFEFESLYVPLHQGDTVRLTIDGKTYICLVKNVEPKFEPGMAMKIRLKAVA